MNVNIEMMEEPFRPDCRRWRVEVRDKADQPVRFLAELPCRELQNVPGGCARLGRHWDDVEVARAVIHAIEEALSRPPKKKSGEDYFVRITSLDLYRGNGGHCAALQAAATEEQSP